GPPSGRYSPYRTFIRVDLPAPFSPSSEWISPGSTTRSMASLATKVPKVFVIPRSSSFTAFASVGAGRAAGPARFGTWCAVPARGQGPRTGQRGSGALRGGLRLDDHVAADDLLLEGLQLLGELRGDLVLEVVVRGQAHAAVLERAHVRGAVELALGGAGDDVLDAHGHLLHDGGEDDGLRLGVGGVGLVAVGVDPDHHAVLALLGGGEGAGAHGAGDRHDDVGAGAVELVGDGLALGLVLEGADDGAGLLLLVPAEHLDVLVVGLVVVGDAVDVAVHEDGDGGDVHAAVGGDLAGLGHPGCQVSGQERGLGGVELERLDVVELDRVAVGVLGGGVHDREVGVGVLLRGRTGGRGQQEADGDDQVAVLGDHVVDVRCEVGDRGGLRSAGLDPEGLLRVLQALVAGLVEGLVVPAAGVRDHAGLVVARGTAGIAAAAGALLR